MVSPPTGSHLPCIQSGIEVTALMAMCNFGLEVPSFLMACCYYRPCDEIGQLLREGSLRLLVWRSVLHIAAPKEEAMLTIVLNKLVLRFGYFTN